MRPNFVASDWKVAAEFVKDYKGLEEYAPVKVTLQCADGTKMEKPGRRLLLLGAAAAADVHRTPLTVKLALCSCAQLWQRPSVQR